MASDRKYDFGVQVVALSSFTSLSSFNSKTQTLSALCLTSHLISQFGSVQDGNYVLGKAHMRSTPSQKCPQLSNNRYLMFLLTPSHPRGWVTSR